MNELIKVQHNEDGTVAVSGRELHEFLGMRTTYTQWFDNMLRYGFEENTDYVVVDSFSQKYEKGVGVGRPSVNHTLTMDMAKELSMIQRNEKGKQARRYFIEVEKKFKQGVQAIAQPSNKEISIQERLKIMELIVNAPDGVADTVVGLAKPYQSPEFYNAD